MKNMRKCLCTLLACSVFALGGCAGITGGFSGVNESNNHDTQGGDGSIPVVDVPNSPVDGIVKLPQAFDFTPDQTDWQYGYRYFSGLENGDKFCAFYNDLYSACCGLTEEENVEPKKQMVQAGDGEPYEIELYIVETLDYKKHGLTAEEALAVWKTFRTEYPEFYWMDNEVTYGSSTLNVQIYKEYALGSVRAGIQDKIEALANDCYGYLSADMTQLELALTIYDYVVLSTHYAYKADNETPEDAIWAHTLVGIAEQGKGVCETYAKAFEYLCALVGFDVITVTGKAGQTAAEIVGHAWNMIKIDGVWYTVDTTWGDQEYTGYLYREWFGKGNADFYALHEVDLPVKEFGKTWQYGVPAVAEKNNSPVCLRNEKDEKTLYPCIDEALAAMNNEEGDYAVILHPKTTVMQKETKIAIHQGRVEIQTVQLPKVKKITFVGLREATRVLDMRSVNGVSLGCEIHLQDIAWTYPTMEQNGFEIWKSTFSSYRTDEETTI